MQIIQTLDEALKLLADGKLIGCFKVSNKIYHKIPAFQNSAIPSLLKSISHYVRWAEEGWKMTPAKIVGSMVHSLTLDPNVFKDEFAISPTDEHGNTLYKNSNARKAIWAAFNEEIASQGKQAVSTEQVVLARAMVNSILKKPNAVKLLRGHFEIAFFWYDPETGVFCKGKADVIGQTTGIMSDLKKTTDAGPGPGGFIKSVHNFNYCPQNAHYIDGIALAVKQGGDGGLKFKIPTKFVFIAVEDTEPHCVSLCDLPPDFVQSGREKVKKAMIVYKEYHENKIIKAYPEGIITLKPKGYMYV